VHTSTHPRLVQNAKVAGEWDQQEKEDEILLDFAANKIEPPIKPAPTTEMRLKCNIFNFVWSKVVKEIG
jgi:hypothetical protein